MIYIFWRLCIIKIKWCWNAYGTGYVPLPAKRRENVTGNIIVKPSVRQRFDSFMERGRVLFFSAPCGFGKSTLSDALLFGRDVLRLNAGAADFALPALSDGWEILLIDDFQMIPAEDGGQALCELIRSDPGKRFLLLSRGAPPGYLTAFQYSGLMTTLEADDLLFDREDICKYFSGCGVAVTDSEIGGILRESVGYPLGVAVTARCMSGGRPFGPEVVARAFREVFSYFEAAIYRRFDLPVRRFLLELAPFERFNLEMARMNRIMSRFKKGETAVATVSGISFARLLGVTSPKIRTTMVSTKVDTVAPRSGSSRRVNSTVPMDAAAMLTILLPMRMVESSLSYFSDMASTRAAAVSPSSARLFRRIWFREENAVSEAEKKAENATRITSATKSVILPSSIIKGNHTQLSV